VLYRFAAGAASDRRALPETQLRGTASDRASPRRVEIASARHLTGDYGIRPA